MDQSSQGDFRLPPPNSQTLWALKSLPPQSTLPEPGRQFHHVAPSKVAYDNLDDLQAPQLPSIFARADVWRPIVKTESDSNTMGDSTSFLQVPLNMRQIPQPSIYQAPISKIEGFSSANTYQQAPSYQVPIHKTESFSKTNNPQQTPNFRAPMDKSNINLRTTTNQRIPSYQAPVYNAENFSPTTIYQHHAYSPVMKDLATQPTYYEESLKTVLQATQPYRFFIPWREHFIPIQVSVASKEGRRRTLAEVASLVGTIAYTTCKPCEEGRGPFEECIVVGKLFDGRCSCCVYEGRRCPLAWPEYDDITGAFV